MTLQNQLIYKAFLLFGVVLSIQIEAHSRNESYSTIHIFNKEAITTINIKANIRLDIYQQFSLPREINNAEELFGYFIQSFKFQESCKATESSMPTINTTAGYIKVAWELTCDTMPSQYQITLFQDFSASHNHLSKVMINDQLLGDFIFNVDSDSKALELQTNVDSRAASVLNFVSFGVGHILTGYDHLLFILGLLILFARLRLFLSITGFTVGHSISIFLGSLGVVIAEMNLVESLIGFSIFFLGYEYFYHYLFSKNINFKIWKFIPLSLLVLLYVTGMISFLLFLGLAFFSFSYLRIIGDNKEMIKPLLITGFFGLIHGLGFASNLSGAGFTDNLLMGVLGFNIGVEIGQLIFAFLALIVFKFISYLFGAYYLKITKHAISSLLISFGIFWFIVRLI